MWWLAVHTFVACCVHIGVLASLSPTMKLFEWNEWLMVTNGSFVWHTVHSERASNSDVIEFHLVGPYPLFKEQTNNQTVKIDFAFIASSGSVNCTVFVLVEPNLHYRSWRVKAPAITELEYHQQLFELEPYAGKEQCEMNIWQKEGLLQQIYLLAPLLGNSSQVGSIFTRHNHTRLYILATEGAISVDLKSQHEKVERLLQNYNFSDKHVNITVYRELYAIQNTAQSSQICKIHPSPELSSFKVENKCSQIEFKFIEPFGIRSQLVGFQSNDESETTTTDTSSNSKSSSDKAKVIPPFLTLVLGVAGGVTIMMIIYLFVVHNHCRDTVATIQMTGLNPKFIASLESVDSIKTLDSEKLQAGPSQTPTPRQKP